MLGVFAALLAGCKGLGDISGGGGGTPTTPTPSASPTISPAPCATIYQGSNLVVVGMGPQFSAITATPYPSVAGYAVGNGTGSYPYTATLINKTAGGVANITTKNVLQFVNVDTNPYAYHSAAGFAG
ncbi:MAG: hypothetical protein JO199_03990, partial [Candidatus Eremiobacteraeota bacterium]|nr:hypothetical protein [Candidatus Eremiobacteraeota bacterium]